MLGTKVGGLIGSVATMIPGITTDMDAPVLVGKMLETDTKDINGDDVLEITFPAGTVNHDNAGAERAEGLASRMGQAMGMDSHDASHLVQQGSGQNPFHSTSQ